MGIGISYYRKEQTECAIEAKLQSVWVYYRQMEGELWDVVVCKMNIGLLWTCEW